MTEVLYAVRLNIEAFDNTTISPLIGAVFYMYMETWKRGLPLYFVTSDHCLPIFQCFCSSLSTQY